AVGVVFKGSGFYRTDSRSPQKTESGSKKESGDSSTKSETSAASKPKETASN
ncbi:MAG TPA: FmdB family transcriptional regulator, partial [Nocardioides sp.]|nr:FmdB family transcriptional regulator [Nocardioides sp.]